MRAALVLLLAACGGSDDYAIDPDHGTNPPPPGGKHDAGFSVNDGTTDDAVVDATAMLAGRVCLFSDARAFTTCQSTGVGGLTVKLDTQTATTNADGTFTMAMPTGTTTNLLWHVTGALLQTSVMRYSEGNLIPAITIANYNMLEDNNGVSSMQLGTGAVIANVLAGGTKVKGATVDVTPQQLYAPYYDGTNPQVWLQVSTGAAGVVWQPDATLGSLTAKATFNTLSATLILPIEDQSITYTTFALQ